LGPPQVAFDATDLGQLRSILVVIAAAFDDRIIPAIENCQRLFGGLVAIVRDAGQTIMTSAELFKRLNSQHPSSSRLDVCYFRHCVR
jgi:hypothetical protein